MATVSRVRVDDTGIFAVGDDEVVLDVLFDERRVWSFWLKRDGVPADGGWFVAWPGPLTRFLVGTTKLAVVEHVSGNVVFDEEVTLGDAPEGSRIAVEDDEGRPLGLDKSNRLARTFDTRSDDQVAPLLDSIEEVLAAIKKAGIDAFPAYGTLLGAVRAGKLIGHDSDADLGYVSEHSAPVDVIRESFRLQRRLAGMGYSIYRYSGAAFRVDVVEGDGSVRGLDVFGGFLADGHLVLMGEIRTPFEREWIFPLGTTTLESRPLPAPADTDRFLTATYGPSWRVPDPAFHFETPQSTHRRLNGWFRGTRGNRWDWDRHWSSAQRRAAPLRGHGAARWLHEEQPELTQVIDLGCGRGADLLWLARRGVAGIGLDFSPRSFERAAKKARKEELPLEFHDVNLLELRHALSWGARFAHDTGHQRAVLARHLVDTTDSRGRHQLWRVAEMALRAGGRLYLEFLATGGQVEAGRKQLLRAIDPELVIRELEARGATIVSWTDLEAGRGESTDEVDEDNEDEAGAPAGRRICRMVVEWQA